MEAFLKNFDLVPLDLVMVAAGIVLFLSLWKILQVVLFGPFLRLLEVRESETTGTQESAAATAEQADSLIADYDRQMTEVRVAALKKKFTLTESAKGQAAQILGKAEGEARDHTRVVRAAISKELAELNESAEQEVRNLADVLTERVKLLAGRRSAAGKGVA